MRSSFHTTICVLEGLLAFETSFGVMSAVTDARRRAEECLLERRLLRRVSGGVGEPNRWITLRARRALDWHARQ